MVNNRMPLPVGRLVRAPRRNNCRLESVAQNPGEQCVQDWQCSYGPIVLSQLKGYIFLRRATGRVRARVSSGAAPACVASLNESRTALRKVALDVFSVPAAAPDSSLHLPRLKHFTATSISSSAKGGIASEATAR
eukprot:560671-Pyramimonas_sp.AAC.1